MTRTHLPLALSLLIGATSFAQDATTHPIRDPHEIRNGIEMGATTQEHRRLFYEHVISRIEPSLHGDVNHLPQYLDFFAHEFVEDPRTFAVALKFDILGDDQAVVHGYLEFAEQKSSLSEFFKQLNLPGVSEDVELLPSTDLGEKKFGVIMSPRAFIYDKPEGKRETLTECRGGETIYVLKAVGGSLLCHSPGGYIGYIDAKSVRLISQIMLDQIESSIAVERGSQIETMIAAAQKFIGVKYVWGGNSADGIDCSGLVYEGFKSIGFTMPRDADQQFLMGRLVATRWHRTALRRGDTLYFISSHGTIHHTAIYLGDNQYLEAADNGAKVASFDSKAPNYDAKRDKSFCFGKRVLE
jgi:hypothetical protein